MTREEAIENLRRLQNLLFNDPYIDTSTIIATCNIAIEALEQEPILDKIRAEIESLSNANPSYWHSGDMVEREEVFEIIDKYKAESEEK